MSSVESVGHELLLWPLWTNFEQVWITQPGRCWDCHGPTHWADLNFMVFLHPGVCAKNKWREYQEAERAARERETAMASDDSPA
jgi:hypothetical protein